MMAIVKLYPVHAAPNSGAADGMKVVSVDMGAGTSACACSGAGAKKPPELREFPVLSVAEVVERERGIAAAGTSLAELMDNAGAALAAYVSQNLFEGARVLVLCGSGNNGGDGWVAARLLADAGFAVTVLALRAPEDVAAEPARSAACECVSSEYFCPDDLGYDLGGVHRYCVYDAGSDSDAFDDTVIVVRFGDEPGETTHLICDFSDCNVIIDCLLGTGFGGGTVKEPTRSLIERANAARAFRVACDVPSGMNADTGEAADVCFQADTTVTMLAAKRGLLVPEAVRFAGALFVAPIEEY